MNNNTNSINSFTNEFYALLKKYNVNIYWQCHEASDMDGIFGEQMILSFNVGNKEQIITIDGGGFGPDDFENLAKNLQESGNKKSSIICSFCHKEVNYPNLQYQDKITKLEYCDKCFKERKLN